MIRSMTGYGDASRETPEGVIRVEMKTVNHRYFNTQIRTPSALDALETRIQARLKSFVSRGHVNMSIRIERDETERESPLPELDAERARHYLSLLRDLQDALGLVEAPDISDLIRFRDIFVEPEISYEAPSIDETALFEAIDEAAEGVVGMREVEGQHLHDDMEERISSVADHLDRIGARAPERIVAERDRLRSRIRELVDSGDVDEDRLAQEIAYLAEKWDINEELVRFRAHIEHFREILDAPGDEPVGKRLGFVVQEMHREANTIGAKANDATISQAVIGIKEEIERLREQVENVE